MSSLKVSVRAYFLLSVAMLSCAFSARADYFKATRETRSNDAVPGLNPVPSVQHVSNSGFLKEPPPVLKEKFPMCDAFLKVGWIDKKRRFGYSTYEVYGNGRKLSGKAFALVHLDQAIPSYENSLKEYKKSGQLKELFSVLRTGEIDFNFSELQLKKKRADGATVVWGFESVADEWGVSRLSLSDGRMNVCIPYPDSERVFFAEIRRFDRGASKTEIEAVIAQIKNWVPKLEFFEESVVLDLNFDGVPDYFTGSVFIYSNDQRYFELKERPASGGDSVWISPSNKKTCEVLVLSGVYLTADSRNFYLNDRCNLTELMSGEK